MTRAVFVDRTGFLIDHLRRTWNWSKSAYSRVSKNFVGTRGGEAQTGNQFERGSWSGSEVTVFFRRPSHAQQFAVGDQGGKGTRSNVVKTDDR